MDKKGLVFLFAAFALCVMLLGSVNAKWFTGDATSPSDSTSNPGTVNTNAGAEGSVVLKRGDVTKDGKVDQADITFLLNHLFKGGPAPVPMELGDVDADETISIADLTYLISYLERGGPAPVPLEDTEEVDYIRGDLNNDGAITISDVTFLVNYLYKNGTAPNPMWVADVDGNDGVGYEDINYLTNYLFKGGPAPVETNEEVIECALDNDCPVHYKCIFDQCIPLEACGVNSDCGRYEECSDGFCVSSVISCLFAAPFGCYLDLVYVTEEGIVFGLRNGGGITYSITKVDLSECDEKSVTIGGLPLPFMMEDLQKVAVSVECAEGDLVSGETFTSDVLISYKAVGGSLEMTSSGTISVIIGQSNQMLKRGDLNGDGNVDVADLTYLVSYIYKNGTAPNPLNVADVNADGKVDDSDIAYLTNYLFAGGPAPVIFVNQTIASCSDSDGGLDYYTLGKVTTGKGESEDKCYEEGKSESVNACSKNCFVMENYCFGNQAGSMRIRCESSCSNGVCVTPSPKDRCAGLAISRGDINKDGKIDNSDMNIFVNYLFKNGAPPEPLELGDANNDGNINVADLTYLVTYMNGQGDAPKGEGITGPPISVNTRVNDNGVKYCDPTSLKLKAAKGLSEDCVSDYECNSNACLDGECVSIKQELEKQEGLLRKIWCWITNIGSNSGFEECVAGEGESEAVNQGGNTNTNVN